MVKGTFKVIFLLMLVFISSLTIIVNVGGVSNVDTLVSRTSNDVTDVSGSNLDETILPSAIEANTANGEEKAENPTKGNYGSSASFSGHAMCKDKDGSRNPVNLGTISPEHVLSVDDLLGDDSKPQNSGFQDEAVQLRSEQMIDHENSVLESAIPQPTSSSTTLFTEGFEGSFPSTNWWVGDDDSRNGADYWDDTSHRSRGGSWSSWCADIGSKPDGTPNTADWTYDDYMAAYLSRRAGAPFDARNWDIAFLTYYVWYDIESGYDELDLSVTGDGTSWEGIFQYGSNSLTSGDWALTGSSGGVFDYRVGRVPESTSAGAVYTSSFNIGFYFQSDVSIHKGGAYLDDLSFKVYDITSPYVSVSKAAASPGDTIQLGYKIDNISPFNLKIWLGATLTDQYGNQINDPAHDTTVTATPGYRYYYRDFHIPSSANPGTYDITYALWSGWTSPIDQSRQWWSWTWNDILKVGTKDLTIQDIWTQPSSPESGNPTTIWFRVKNIGTLDVTDTFRNYLYIDGSYYTYRENSGLGIGASYDWSIPNVYLSPGSHALKVKADATDTVSESNEGNNERTETTYWKGPDLIVLDIWWDPSTPTAGQPFTIYFKIKNQGDGNAYGTFRSNLYIDGNYYAHGDNNGLNAGSTYTWQTPNVRLSSDPHTFKVVVDADNAVQEHNEGNNQRSELCTIVKADWAVFAYLDGDCDPDFMEQFALNAFVGMAQIGSSGDLSIVVQLDRRPEAVVDPVNDWTDTCRFFVTQGMSYAHSNALWSDEVNMGDDNTLIDFVTWAINTRHYEADHYLLVLQNHGGSWVGCCWDRTSGNDRLDLSEIKSAMSSIKSTLGKKVDVLWFNDCLMSGIEVAMQVYPYADYMAGSESIAYTSTWSTAHYNTLMTTLRNTPSTSPQQLCVQITNIGTLTDSAIFRTQSISSIDLSKMSSLVSTVDSFALNLKNKLCTYYPQIDNARRSTGWFEGPYGGDQQELIDLYHFAQNVKSNVPDSTIKSLAQNIMDKIGPTGGAAGYVIMRERHTTSVSYAHGLSIYFPLESADYDSSYTTGSDFAANTRWDEFLVAYYTPKPDLTITVTAIDPSPPVSEQPVRIWFTLKNIGYGDASETFVNKFYVDGTYVGSQTQNGLEAGGVVLILYDTTLGPGYHVTRAVADANNNVAECDETNNEDTKNVWWLSPDLIVEDIWWDPASPQENQPFTVYCRIKNRGDTTAVGTFHTKLYVDGNPYYDWTKVGLSAGATHTFSVTHTLPHGTYMLMMVVDADNEISEANQDTGHGIGTGETNNERQELVTVIEILYAVHLESQENTGATRNLGTITFDGTSYSLPDDVPKAAATYSTEYFADVSYMFDHWETSGAFSVPSSSDNPTTVTVRGDGTLSAIYRMRNQPPSILYIYPDSEIAYQGDTIRIYCDSTDPETPESSLTCKIWIKPSGDPWAVNGETMSWDGSNHYYDWNIPTSAKLGYYDVNCTVSDGELSDWRMDYNEFEVVDTTPPVVQITNPITSSPIYTQSGTTITVNYTYTELNSKNSTIKICNATHIIGETVVTSLVPGVDVTRSDFVNIAVWAIDGAYNVTVTIYDMAEQTGKDIQTNAVIIDNTPPAVNITYPTSNAYISALGIWINGTVTETNKGDPQPSINDTRFTLMEWNSATGYFGFSNNTAIPEGPITVEVSFTDLAGNTGSDTVTFSLGIHDVAVINIEASKTVVGQNYATSINVTVENQGDYAETFNITAYYNDTAIILPNGKNYTTITLLSGNYATVTFTWNTTGIPKGNYTISAYAEPIPGEPDTIDNTLTDGWVVVTIPGDIDGNHDVDYMDLYRLAKTYGSKRGDPNYDPEADINCDGKVDYNDLYILARHYGQEDP